MKRVIYSIYIDIPHELLAIDAQHPHHGDTEDKNEKAKRMFAEYFDWLVDRQKKYAESIGANYVLYEEDQDYLDYRKWFNDNHPYITEYNIVNFYKIHLMYKLKENYDEILYMDLDVVPVTKENFFEAHNLKEGVAIKKNVHGQTVDTIHLQTEQDRYENGKIFSIRSPRAKWWNSKALCMEYGSPSDDLPVYNTGIVGINKYWLEKIDYFADFDQLLEDMKELKEDEFSMFHPFVQSMFGWDNETIWGFKCHINDVPSNWLNTEWHMFLDKENFIPIKSKFVHVIHKKFDVVEKWVEENNL